MGDVRYQQCYDRVATAEKPSEEIAALSDEEVIAALAAAANEGDRYLANVLATEAMNRVRRARTVTEHLGEGLFAVDRHGRATFLNPAAERMLGWRADELRGEHFHTRVHSRHEDGSTIPWERCPLYRALATGKSQKREDHGHAFTRKDGRRFPIALTAAPVHREDEVVGAVGVFLDITPERQTEQALRESEERFRALSNAASEAILIHQGGRTLLVNEAFTRMVGYDADEAIGRSVLEFVAPEHREKARDILVKRPEEPYALRVLRKDGSTFRAHITGRNVHYRGTPARVIAVMEAPASDES